MRVSDALRGVAKIGLDTSAVIAFVEQEPQTIAVCRAVFQVIDQGGIQAVAGMVMLAEVLVGPLKNGNNTLVTAYRDLLTRGANVELLPITQGIAERTADLRARHGLKTPDALQIAAAIESGCDAFLTGDTIFNRVSGITVLITGALTV